MLCSSTSMVVVYKRQSSSCYQIRDKPFNAIIVIYGIMVKADLTVRCHIWYH